MRRAHGTAKKLKTEKKRGGRFHRILRELELME